MKNFIICICLLSILASCTTQNLLTVSGNDYEIKTSKPDSTFHYNPDYQYIIRKDDKISISIWGQDELSVGSVYGIYNSNEVYGKWLMVDVNGNIELPRIGTMKVVDKTIPSLKDTLRMIFGQWIINPIVDVKVLNKEITVLGEVRNPGVVKVDKDNNTLLELIAQTGGFEFYANLKSVKVLRQQGEHVRVASLDLTRSEDYLNKNIQLHPGDMVVVPSVRYKQFDKRISTIVPFTSTITAAAIFLGAF